MTLDELYQEARQAILHSPPLQIVVQIDPRLLESEMIFAALVNMYALGVKAGMLKALNENTDQII